MKNHDVKSNERDVPKGPPRRRQTLLT